jgi:YVTN family beta-propeller protein
VRQDCHIVEVPNSTSGGLVPIAGLTGKEVSRCRPRGSSAAILVHFIVPKVYKCVHSYDPDGNPSLKERLLTMNPTNTKARVCKLLQFGIIWMLIALPVAASTVRVYVTNLAGTTISVVDPETNKVVQEIKNIEVPESVQFSPDGSRLYITQGPENVLTVLDRKTEKLVKQVPISGHANDLAVTKDGKYVLICISETPGALDIIDTTSLEKVKTIPTKSRLHDIVLTGDGKYAVADSPQGKFAIVFDLRSLEPAWQVEFDQEALVPAIESNPDGSGRRLFIQLSGLRGFAVVDFESRKEVARIKFPDDEPTVPPSGTPSHGLGVSPDRKTLWAVSRIYDSVFVYSLPDLKFMGRVHLPQVAPPGRSAVGGSPNWITFTPDSKTAYIANGADRSVSAVDMNTLKVVARIPTGEEPGRMSTLVLP